jgi:hypothetical protein
MHGPINVTTPHDSVTVYYEVPPIIKRAKYTVLFTYYRKYNGGRDSSVSIEKCYGLDGPGIESRWK